MMDPSYARLRRGPSRWGKGGWSGWGGGWGQSWSSLSLELEKRAGWMIRWMMRWMKRGKGLQLEGGTRLQGCIFRLTCSHPELTEDHVLTSTYVKIFRTVTRNAVNKSVWRKKDCSWPPLNKYAMNVWLSSLRIRAHLSWRTGKHLHVLHVLVSRILGYHNLCSPDHHLHIIFIITMSSLSFSSWQVEWAGSAQQHYQATWFL